MHGTEVLDKRKAEGLVIDILFEIEDVHLDAAVGAEELAFQQSQIVAFVDGKAVEVGVAGGVSDLAGGHIGQSLGHSLGVGLLIGVQIHHHHGGDALRHGLAGDDHHILGSQCVDLLGSHDDILVVGQDVDHLGGGFLDLAQDVLGGGVHGLTAANHIVGTQFPEQVHHALTGSHIDFDYGEEEMMSRMASVDTVDGTPVLRVGKASYKTVIVSNMLTIRPTTLALLKDFMAKGGKVIFCGDAPAYGNAIASDEPAKLAEQGITIPYNEAALVAAVRENACEFVAITNGEGETEKAVFAQVRKDFGGDGYAVVVLNTDRANPRENLTLAIKAPAGYAVEEWDLENGTRYDASALAGEVSGTYYISMDLEAAGTRCFVLTKCAEELPAVTEYETVASETLTGEFPYAAHEPNVCVLDWCKWRWKDGEWHDEAEALWADRQIRSDIGIEWRGGGMLQPWYAKLNDTKKYGELQLSYEFYIDEMPEFDVILAGERPELPFCNLE